MVLRSCPLSPTFWEVTHGYQGIREGKDELYTLAVLHI